MNPREIYKILLVIESVYPQFELSNQVFKVWVDYLKGTDYELAQHNLRLHLLTENTPPVIADILRKQSSSPVPKPWFHRIEGLQELIPS